MSKLDLSAAPLDLIAARFRVLAEPFRLRLLATLQPGPLPVSQLVEALEASQPNVSKHLQILAASGLLNRSRQGNSILYAIADPAVFKLCSIALRSATRHSQAELDRFLAAPKATHRKKK